MQAEFPRGYISGKGTKIRGDAKRRADILAHLEEINTIRERTDCRMCHGALALRLEFKPTPHANAFQDEPGEVEKYPLNLMECVSCGHVQTQHVVPSVFGGAYPYRTPQASAQHLLATATILKKRHRVNSHIVEIGSNNGLYTEILKDTIGPIINIDPSGTHWACWKTPFNEWCAQRIHERHGLIDLVVSNNTFAHINDLDEVFRGIDHILSDEGAVVIEVQDFMASVERGVFDMVYHEHLDYHTAAPWVKLLEAHNLQLSGVERINPHGGSLRITATRYHRTEPPDSRINWTLFRNGKAEAIHKVKRANPKVAWGATAKLTTLIHECELELEYCVDSTPQKQGKYLPGTATPILAEFKADEKRPVLLGAWNFETEFNKQFPRLEGVSPYG